MHLVPLVLYLQLLWKPAGSALMRPSYPQLAFLAWTVFELVQLLLLSAPIVL